MNSMSTPKKRTKATIAVPKGESVEALISRHEGPLKEGSIVKFQVGSGNRFVMIKDGDMGYDASPISSPDQSHFVTPLHVGDIHYAVFMAGDETVAALGRTIIEEE